MNKPVSFLGRPVVRFPVIVLAVWLVLTAAALADIRIVTNDEDDMRQEYLFQGPRVALLMPEGERFIVFCDSGTFALVDRNDSAYWYGTPQQFRDELDDMFALLVTLDEDFFTDYEPVTLAELFRGEGYPAVNVRTSRVGTETVAGYEAYKYSVQYERDGVWKTHEHVWVAPDLLRQIDTETGGSCMNTVVTDLLRSYLAMMIFDMMDEFGVMWSITTSPEYADLMEEGFVVRDESIVETFGMTFKTSTEVQSVGHEPLDESWFTTPPDAEPMTLLEAAM